MIEDRALHLYERSLAGQWNADRGIDWKMSTEVASPEIDAARKRLINELYWSEQQSLWTVQRMNEPIRAYFKDHHFSLCAAPHNFDESRHAYVLERYCRQIGALGACPMMWTVITRVADMMGASVVNYFYSILISETLGEVLFAMLRKSKADDLLKAICENALRDEARHIAYVTEALRRIHPRLGRLARARVGLTLRAMLYFGLRSLRRTEADATTLGVDRDAYLDTFERKLCASIRRAGVEDVLSPDGVTAIVGRFRDRRGDIVGNDAIAEMTALEDGAPSLRAVR
ncbi:MAG TPA: diiron oxygenase [Kofleriaceae bacterium]|nr:diiron oxygenase [Kofleriaceae bacterium]